MRQREGCGTAGDTVTLFFPESGRFASQSLTFKQGGERQDITLAGALQYRLFSIAAAKD